MLVEQTKGDQVPLTEYIEKELHLTVYDDPMSKVILNELLAQTFACYLIANARDPVAKVICDLTEIEQKAAVLVDAFYDEKNLPKNKLLIDGCLPAVFYFLKRNKD